MNFIFGDNRLVFTGTEPKNDHEAKALVLEKWDLLRNDPVLYGTADDTCGFCMTHPHTCDGCPIQTATSLDQCHNTPFYNYRSAMSTNDTEVAKRLAGDMYDLVASLVISEDQEA